MKGIGLFGGTFNPLHNGHLKVAEDVKAAFCLETIYFIPSAIPPHKGTEHLADAKDRFAMIQSAMPPGKGFVASDVEINRSGPSYSIDTVRYFKNKIPVSTPIYLMVGMDAFLEINTWKSYQEFFDLVPIIIMTRPEEGSEHLDGLTGELEDYIRVYVDPEYEFFQQKSCFIHPAKQSVLLSYVTPVDISSTQIRNFVRQGVSIRRMVPDTVEKYIYKKGLYL